MTAKRPWRCQLGWHKQAPSFPDPVHGEQGYWLTECPRCGAKWCFSYGPFLVKRRWFGTRIARRGGRR